MAVQYAEEAVQAHIREFTSHPQRGLIPIRNVARGLATIVWHEDSSERDEHIRKFVRR